MKAEDESNSNDDELWAQIIRSVTPLPGKEGEEEEIIKRSAETHLKKEENEDKKGRQVPAQAKGKNQIGTEPYANKRQSMRSAGRELDKRTEMKLRRGQYPIEGTLDLHGMSRHNAFERLKAFLQISYNQQKRCVIVITGKGIRTKHTEGFFEKPVPKGILRQNLPKWLQDATIRDIVLAHHPARPKHGGDGAFYVLLRRHRGNL